MNKQEVVTRAARIRLVAMDVDGVLTDGGVFYSEEGEALKRCHMRDGMGIVNLHEALHPKPLSKFHKVLKVIESQD